MLPVPSKLGKGVLISPTIYGNVMLGPTAEDMTDRADTSTTEDGYAFLLERGERIMPRLLKEEVTATYAGLRAASDVSDYTIDVDAGQRYAVAGDPPHRAHVQHGGRRAPAGSAAQSGTGTARAHRPAGAAAHAQHRRGVPRPYADAERIAADRGTARSCASASGSRGARSATRSRARSRRATWTGCVGTRAMNGRCQGYCGANVTGMLADALRTADEKGER